MSETPTTQQFPARRRFGFFFIFRIAPGFFVGFFPRRGGVFSTDQSYQSDDEMVIQRINEHEYMFLQRLGVPEASVMMGYQY